MRGLVCDCSCNWKINYLKQNTVLDYWSRDVEDIEAEIRLVLYRDLRLRYFKHNLRILIFLLVFVSYSNFLVSYRYIQGCLCFKHDGLNICLKHSFKRMFKRSVFKTYYVLNIV